MFNNYQFNSSVFNEISLARVTAPQDNIVYNGYSLQNENIIVSSLDFDNGYDISSETYSNPLTDLGGELNYFFREKKIKLSGVLKSDTAENLNIKIDELKKILGQNNKNLDIKVNGTIRRAKASCININSLFNRNNYNLTFINFNIEFRVLSSFFTELTRQNQTFTGLTSGFIEEIINKGSVRVEPTISILINSATSVTNFSFKILDKTITLNRTFIASESLVIDCKEKTVKINNIEVDYSGVFPILEVGTNSYTITFNGTINYDITLFYFNNYL